MLYWQAVGIENVNQSLRSASLIQNGAQATISSNRHILSNDSWSICSEDSIDRGTRTGRKLWRNIGRELWEIIPVLRGPKNNSKREIKIWQYIRRRAINCPNSVVISAQVRLSPHKAAVKPVLSKTRNFLQRILSFFSNKEKQMKSRLSIYKLQFSVYAHIFSISA